MAIEKLRLPLLGLALVMSPIAAIGQTDRARPAAGLTRLSLEDLSNIEIVSVSKKEQKTSEVAAALYVINEEDIRRSGLTSLPELLRLAPGLQVSRIDGNKWAVSSRGFNGRFSNKMLVVIDGRS